MSIRGMLIVTYLLQTQTTNFCNITAYSKSVQCSKSKFDEICVHRHRVFYNLNTFVNYLIVKNMFILLWQCIFMLSVYLSRKYLEFMNRHIGIVNLKNWCLMTFCFLALLWFQMFCYFSFGHLVPNPLLQLYPAHKVKKYSPPL